MVNVAPTMNAGPTARTSDRSRSEGAPARCRSEASASAAESRGVQRLGPAGRRG